MVEEPSPHECGDPLVDEPIQVGGRRRRLTIDEIVANHVALGGGAAIDLVGRVALRIVGMAGAESADLNANNEEKWNWL